MSENRMASDLAHEVGKTEAKKPYTAAKEAIEEAMCVDSAALTGVYAGAEEDFKGANHSLGKYANTLDVSIISDSTPSQYQLDPETRTLKSGWAVDDEKKQRLCATRDLSEPLAPDGVDAWAINNAVSKIDLLDLDSEKALEAWFDFAATMSEETNKEKQAAARHFFTRILWRLDGGDIGSNQVTLSLVNQQIALAHTVSQHARALACFDSRINYFNTEKTIAKLNRGDVSASEFSMNCAIARDGQLKMLFDVDSSNAQRFSNAILALTNQYSTKIIESHEQLMRSFSAKNEVSLAASTVLAKLRFEQLKADSDSDEFHQLGINMRLKGFLGFGYDFVGMTERFLSVAESVSGAEGLAVSSPVKRTTSFSGEAAYVPDGMRRNILKPFIMPSFIYFEEIDKHDVAKKIESNLQAQIDSSQGGTAGAMIKYTGNEFAASGAKPALTQSQLLDVAGESIIDDLTVTIVPISSTNPEITAGQLRRKVTALCSAEGTPSSTELEKLGISRGEYHAICRKQSTLSLAHYRNQSLKAIDASATLAAVGISAIAGNKIMKKIRRDKQATDGSISKKKTANDPISSVTGKIFSESGAPKMVTDKITTVAAGLVNSSFMQYLASGLLSLALIFACLSMVIYLLPSLLFSFAAFTLVSTVLVYTVFGSVLLLTLVIVGGQFPVVKKALYGGLVNMLLRPLFLFVGLLISILAVQVAHELIDYIMLSMSELTGAGMNSITTLVHNLIKSIVGIALLLWLMREGVSYAFQATDRLIEKMGAASISEDDGNSTMVVGSAAAVNHTVDSCVSKIAK
ncbi:hypothetical protein BGK46_06185 [Salinivibrio sp. SS2]|nr:hypothetical protein BGK46_06185 [Salinivibrio sp. DV]